MYRVFEATSLVGGLFADGSCWNFKIDRSLTPIMVPSDFRCNFKRAYF